MTWDEDLSDTRLPHEKYAEKIDLQSIHDAVSLQNGFYTGVFTENAPVTVGDIQDAAALRTNPVATGFYYDEGPAGFHYDGYLVSAGGWCAPSSAQFERSYSVALDGKPGVVLVFGERVVEIKDDSAIDMDATPLERATMKARLLTIAEFL